MAFCKTCTCGKKVIFERRFSFPDQCPDCGRRLMDFQTYSEEDLPAEKEVNQSTETVVEKEVIKKKSFVETDKVNTSYALHLEDGNEISIPDEGGIIGRTEIGAEILAPYNSVSRKHIKVIVRKNIGVMIEDLSSYGTLINGQRIERNSPTIVKSGAIITLCNVKAELIAKGD